MHTRKSRLGKVEHLRSPEHYVAEGATAPAAIEFNMLVGVNCNTANRFYPALRMIIAEKIKKATPLRVEVDESYLAVDAKANEAEVSQEKVPVFGLLKRGGRVCTLPIPSAKAKTLMPILESRVVPNSVVYMNSFSGYGALDFSGFHHRHVDHGKAFAKREENKCHINGIEKLLESNKTTSTQIQRHSA